MSKTAANFEVKTHTMVVDGAAVVTLRVNFLPRGSGNRNAARRLADQASADPLLAPHLISVVAGTSSVVIELRPTLELAAVINSLADGHRQRAADRDQLPLFGGPLPATA